MNIILKIAITIFIGELLVFLGTLILFNIYCCYQLLRIDFKK